MPRFRLEFSPRAARGFDGLARTDKTKHKRVLKTLGFLELDPRHAGFQTHRFVSLSGPDGEKVFEAYVDLGAGAYRVFWYYGPGRGVLTILAITPHP